MKLTGGTVVYLLDKTGKPTEQRGKVVSVIDHINKTVSIEWEDGKIQKITTRSITTQEEINKAQELKMVEKTAEEWADEVALEVLKSKMGLARIAYEGFSLQVNGTATSTKWNELVEADQLGWCRAVMRVEAEVVLRLHKEGRLTKE